MKNKIFFYIFLIFSILCLFYTWFSFYNKNLINVIVETKIENNDDVLLKINDEYFAFKQFNNVLNQTIRKNIINAELLINTKHKNEIKSLVIFNDIKMYHYSDFSEFKKSSEKLCSNENCKNYDKYELKKETLKPHKNKLYSFLNSLSHFDKIFYPFFILVALTIFYGYKLKLNNFILPSFVLFLAVILRLSDINSYLPWGDECYSISISNPNLPFLNLFNDPGNPPFYFFLLKIIQCLGSSILSFRILSVIFSILGAIFLFLFLRKNYSNKISNIALFLYAINLPLIYYSQEIRCYSLQVLFSILFLIYTFKILNNSKKKYWLIYGILSVIAVNTHYYQIIFIVSNFLYLTFNFIKTKRKEDLFLLFKISFLTLISFLPYYFLTAHNQALLNSNFNAHLTKISFDLIKKCIYFIFAGFIPLIISIIFLFKKFDNKTKELYFYCFWIIFSIVFIGIVLSLIIRPMMAERYLLFLIPYSIIILSIIFSYDFKNKWAYFLIILCVVTLQVYSKQSFSNYRFETAQSYNTFNLAKNYATKNKKIIVISKTSDSAIKRLYKYQEFDLITFSKHNSYEILEEKIKKLNKKDILIFTPFLQNNKANSENKNRTCYFNSRFDSCIWKIE